MSGCVCALVLKPHPKHKLKICGIFTHFYFGYFAKNKKIFKNKTLKKHLKHIKNFVENNTNLQFLKQI